MKQEDPFGNPLPKGVFYDTTRKRYRVRIYRHSEPVWCSYHYDYPSAISAHSLAKEARVHRIANEGQIISADNYADALRQAI